MEEQPIGTTEETTAAGGEFEREPVPQSRLLGLKSFVGMYAGEHCAGTELVIGPLFVAAGVSAFDVIVGLIVGNALAVLSWMLLCAPIATRARLTLYYQLEKICGPSLVKIYNLANGVMFCFLAGAMITVSATAVGVWAGFPQPNLNDIFPNSVGLVLAVIGVGIAISIVAAFGYESVAKFANIAAPWMVLVFAAFGVVGLKQFMDATGTSLNSPGKMWEMASETIWPGDVPLPGRVKFTFWHVTFFAWFCNMAMHIGMADLSVFRYAKKSWYGVSSAAGMYVGHFMAWIAASLLFAFPMYGFLQSHQVSSVEQLLVENGIDPNPEMPQAKSRAVEKWKEKTAQWQAEYELWEAQKAAGESVGEVPPRPFPDIAAGPLANAALGWVGLLCVIIAGWTTANPTIYRAGLAFQAIVPKTPRFWVTIGTGMFATLIGLFPGISMKLLGFVALYGLVLMPMGAVVFVDFWILKKLGLRDRFAERVDDPFNWAAGFTWVLTILLCLGAVYSGGIQIFFVSLPGWFVAVVLYILLSAFYQNRVYERQSMRTLFLSLAWLALILLVVFAGMYFADILPLSLLKWYLLIVTAIWFVTAPFVRKKE